MNYNQGVNFSFQTSVSQMTIRDHYWGIICKEHQPNYNQQCKTCIQEQEERSKARFIKPTGF